MVRNEQQLVLHCIYSKGCFLLLIMGITVNTASASIMIKFHSQIQPNRYNLICNSKTLDMDHCYVVLI